MDEKEAKKKTFTSNDKLKANRASETEEQMKEREDSKKIELEG